MGSDAQRRTVEHDDRPIEGGGLCWFCIRYVFFWLLPFLKPVHLRRFFPEEGVESFTDAMACAIRHMPLDPARRNVLVRHQFVTGAERCESEEVSVGGADNVDASVFAPFDYVALGHLHGPQRAGEKGR